MAHDRFNFDAFDKLCRDELDRQMALTDEEREEVERWEDYNRVFHPGEIGAVVTRLTTGPELSTLPDPPEAA